MVSPKILIVDDEPFNVDYLEQELEELFYETISACNGPEALAQVEAESPDLILLDIMMPGMDGFEVLTRLKADPAMRDIPVIIISASNTMPSVIKGIELGAEDYLPKPFEPALLHARITSSLEKKRLRDLQKLYLKSLQRELEIGREIQQGFLPAELPDPPGWEIAACFQAAREVAGDFYDAFLLPDGHLVCVLGDVCGKGVGAALFMTLFRSLIRATCTTDYFQKKAAQKTVSPAERLQHVITFTNDYITSTHAEAYMFATIFIGMVNLQDGRLTYINAGHEPPLLLKANQPLDHLTPTGPAVGIIPGVVYSTRETVLQPGESLVVFTDGVTDAINADGINFGADRLKNVLQEIHPSINELLAHLQAQIHQFIGMTDQFDDITLLGIKRSG
jgi:serine phosphatase RsbU (regulator of sigma subunit)